MSNQLILIGVITSAHGIKGEVKIKSFLENSADFSFYKEVITDQQHLKITKVNPIKDDIIIASIEGIENRNQAELLIKHKLFIARDQLKPTAEEEFYYHDLIGLKVMLSDNQEFGVIKNIHNYGAGDIIEVTSSEGATQMHPFNKLTFPIINVTEGYVIINPIEDVE